MSVSVDEVLSAFRRLYPSTKIVPGSLHIRQITNNALTSSTKPSTLVPDIQPTEFYLTTPAPRQCTPVRLNLCKSVLEYNLTSYPNHFGHKNLDEIHDDLVTFRLAIHLLINITKVPKLYDMYWLILSSRCNINIVIKLVTKKYYVYSVLKCTHYLLLFHVN